MNPVNIALNETHHLNTELHILYDLINWLCGIDSQWVDDCGLVKTGQELMVSGFLCGWQKCPSLGTYKNPMNEQ